MYTLFPLLLVLVSGNGLYGQELDQDRQWQEVMTSRISHIESLVSLKDQRIDQLETKLQNQASEILTLRRLIEGKDTVVAKLVRQFADLQKRADNSDDDAFGESLPTLIPGEFHTMTNSTNDVEDDELSVLTPSNESGEVRTKKKPAVSDLVRRSPKLNRVAPQLPIAFHAYLSSTVTLGSHATVVFDHEALDQGDGYNPSEGIYTVPESGTYVITWTMVCYVNNAFQTLLIVNGATTGMSWADSEEIHDFHQVTGTVVIYLNQGDHLYIRMGQIYHSKIYSSPTYSQPTFSGWKLY